MLPTFKAILKELQYPVEPTPLLLQWIEEKEKEWDSKSMSEEKYKIAFLAMLPKKSIDREKFSKLLNVQYGSLRVFMTQDIVKDLVEDFFNKYSKRFVDGLLKSSKVIGAGILKEWQYSYSKDLKYAILEEIKEQMEFHGSVKQTLLEQEWTRILSEAYVFMNYVINKKKINKKDFLNFKIKNISDYLDALTDEKKSNKKTANANEIRGILYEIKAEFGIVPKFENEEIE